MAKAKKRSTTNKPKKIREPTAAEAEILERITNPLNWVKPDTLIKLMRENPSLRGFVYGYVSEYEFVHYLENELEIIEHSKDDDHKKTKSDRTFIRNNRQYTVQLKSLQTNSIREIAPGRFKATVQNDASDSRRLTLPNGEVITTTCYKVGEYDILAASIQPFVGQWKFVFKKNKDLQRSTYDKYTPQQRQYLLATSETLIYPLQPDSGWTTDFFSLLEDPDLGSDPTEEPAADAIVVEAHEPDDIVVIQQNLLDDGDDTTS